MKKPSQDLFNLIQSLTSSEKRYIKIAAKQHIKGDSNNYIKVFDEIAKQKKYDEKALIQKFKDESFSKRYDLVKSYLYQFILKCLRHYNENYSSSVSINNYLWEAEILFDRRLYDESQKILQKAYKLAIKFEQFNELIKIYWWEKRLIIARNFKDLSNDDLKNLFTEEIEFVDKTKEDILYNQLKNKVQLEIIQSSGIRNKEHEEQYKKVSNDILLKRFNINKSFKVKYEYYQIQVFQARRKGDHNLLHIMCKEFVNIFDQNPQFKEEIPTMYANAIFNLIESEIMIERYDDALVTCSLAEKIPFKTTSAKERNRSITAGREMNIYINQKNYKKAIQLIEPINTYLKIYGENPDLTMSYYFQFITAYFGMADYKSALDWVNNILNDKIFQVRKDIVSIVHIINLAIHFELGNINLLEFTIANTYRYLLRRKLLFQFEKVFLNFAKKLVTKININDPKEMHEHFVWLKKNLLLLKNDPKEKWPLEFFDFISWVENK